MNILYILIILNFQTPEVKFETLLGENIEKAAFLGVASHDLDDNIYLISRPGVPFLGKPVRQIVIGTGTNKEIIYIHIILSNQQNENLPHTICKNYGKDYDVMILDQVLSRETQTRNTAESNFTENLEHTSMSIKTGTLSDKNINHILWSKDSYDLMLYYNRFKNREEIHFIKKQT